MTTEEFSREFDILYNNIATSSAPNIDEYEKSVYLTKAQLELVKNTFNPLGNKYGRGFEQSSKRRNDLSNLIKSYSTSNTEIRDLFSKISKDSKSFIIPDDVFLIIFEKAYSDDIRLCKTEQYKELNIIPVTHDEFNTLKDNPFKKPDTNEAWRLDGSLEDDIDQVRTVEIVSDYNIALYSMRYIKYPDPIILVDLDAEFPGENLTIDDQNTIQTSKLNKGIHPEILNRAVELADHDYKGGNFQTRIQLNQRDE